MEKDFNDYLKQRIEESLALLGASAIWKKSQGPILELAVVPGGKAKEEQGMGSVALKPGALALLGAELGKKLAKPKKKKSLKKAKMAAKSLSARSVKQGKRKP